MRTLVLVIVSAVLVLGPACSTTTDNAENGVGSVPASAATLVSPSVFQARVDEPGVVTINVHVPDEGNIAGTDLTIPFDTISDSTALPSDLDTPLAVYCRSGNMSADAVKDLEAMGYTDIVELRGGFNAWIESGLALEAPAT